MGAALDNLAAVHDHVVYESESEKAFVEWLEHRDDVKLFVKLPGWFTVPTPVGEYNPAWAIVLVPRDEFGKPTGEKCSTLYERQRPHSTQMNGILMKLARSSEANGISGTHWG